MDIVLSMPWLFPQTVLSRFSHVQACLCSCFLWGTFSSLQSWCQLDSRAGRKSRCVVDEVGLPVKLNHFCSFFSLSSPGSEVLDTIWVRGPLLSGTKLPNSPAFCATKDVWQRFKIPMQKENTGHDLRGCGDVKCQSWLSCKSGEREEKAFHFQLTPERGGMRAEFVSLTLLREIWVSSQWRFPRHSESQGSKSWDSSLSSLEQNTPPSHSTPQAGAVQFSVGFNSFCDLCPFPWPPLVLGSSWN